MSEITDHTRATGEPSTPGNGLDPVDVATIWDYFRASGREPTEVEMQTLTTVWGALAPVRLLSADIEYDGPPPGPDGNAPPVRQTINGLLPRDPRRAGIDPEDILSGIDGEVTPDGRFQITQDGQVVGDLPLSFLLDGWPSQTRPAMWRPPHVEVTADEPEATRSMSEQLLNMLGQHDPLSEMHISTEGENITPPVASAFEPWLKILSGLEPADRVPSEMAFINVAASPISELDPYRLAWAGVDKVLGELACAGADPQMVVLAPVFPVSHMAQPETLGALIRALQGFDAAALAHESQTIQSGFALPDDEMDRAGALSIHEPLHISASAELTQDSPKLDRGFRQAGNFIFMVGQTRPELGGSLYSKTGGRVRPQHRHEPGPIEEPLVRQRAIHQAMRVGLLRTVSHCSEGGIGLALARLCAGGNYGADIQMRAIPVDPYYAYAADEAILFSESLGRYLVEVRPEDAAAFSDILGDVVHACIGVVGGSGLRIHPRLPGAADPALSISVDTLRQSIADGQTDTG